MKYTIEENKIIFDKNDDFDAESILTCGQMFRYFKTDSGWTVITGHERANISEKNGKVVIECTNPQRFIDFFDLDTDYAKIKSDLSSYDVLKEAISYGKGIRIAKGETEEIIFQFIISQNNNIKRIQKIVEKMCEVGDKIDEKYNAFPSAKKLASLPFEWFKNLGAGYRDVFLYDTAKLLSEIDLDEKINLPSDELYKWLISIKGVGPKVASCIMLFGFHRTECFPVDTWMEKVYRKYFFAGEMTRPQISAFLQEKFGVMSGIVQQYLFNFAMHNGL
ncbi:MAG: hypothetical protein IJS74_02345 [Clostridia bacterium]|nr:hypothetical protein [Clostridia bacterium]